MLRKWIFQSFSKSQKEMSAQSKGKTVTHHFPNYLYFEGLSGFGINLRLILFWPYFRMDLNSMMKASIYAGQNINLSAKEKLMF